ncbi:hypothetical protein GGX14DRAFT_582080 [Mycena pura]|uniref:Uncharacterized protein n=1 Tax=Mycena pura TaxID=153505 RepID=A0AAD6YUI1_9AGAR|nr:hypothetical protein GGX14DRAFT_582080 [Mycena pura]
MRACNQEIAGSTPAVVMSCVQARASQEHLQFPESGPVRFFRKFVNKLYRAVSSDDQWTHTFSTVFTSFRPLFPEAHSVLHGQPGPRPGSVKSPPTLTAARSVPASRPLRSSSFELVSEISDRYRRVTPALPNRTNDLGAAESDHSAQAVGLCGLVATMMHDERSETVTSMSTKRRPTTSIPDLHALPQSAAASFLLSSPAWHRRHTCPLSPPRTADADCRHSREHCQNNRRPQVDQCHRHQIRVPVPPYLRQASPAPVTEVTTAVCSDYDPHLAPKLEFQVPGSSGIVPGDTTNIFSFDENERRI